MLIVIAAIDEYASLLIIIYPLCFQVGATACVLITTFQRNVNDGKYRKGSPMQNMNILVTLDENYLPHLNTMLFSLLRSNPAHTFTVYLLHTSIPENALVRTNQILGASGELVSVPVRDIDLEHAPTTSRYPQEIYYRIFAAKYLPAYVDRVLYLDPDIIINGSVAALYNTPLDDYYFAAASHIGPVLHKVNRARLAMDEDSPYINSGVMLMNLKRLREEQDFAEVFDFIESRKNLLILPDQDIISSLYGSKILALDPFRYNMTEVLYRQHAPFEKSLDLDWIRSHSVVIHYCGRNKPWKSTYFGNLDVFYRETVSLMEQLSN